MDIQTATTTIVTIQLSAEEANGALLDPSQLQAALARALHPDVFASNGKRPKVATAKKVAKAKAGGRKARTPKIKTLICTTCGKVYKRPSLFEKHTARHAGDSLMLAAGQ